MRRKRWDRNEWHDPADVVVPCLVLLVLIVVSSANVSGGAAGPAQTSQREEQPRGDLECDWTVSDAPRSHDSLSVHSLVSGCSEGQLQWAPALSAVNIRFTSQEQVLCFRLESSFVDLLLQLHTSAGLAQLLSVPHTNSQPHELCVPLPKGESWALILETSPDPRRSLASHVSLTYSLHASHEAPGVTPLDEECQPCSSKNLIETFCGSQFAMSGSLHSVETREVYYSKLTVNAHNTLRGERHPHLKREHGRYLLYMPRSCQARSATGSFMFIGHFRLGRPVIRCAARLQQWQKVREKVLKTPEKEMPCWLGDS